MPIYIQTGGAGAQLGGGLGAGFSKGVADAMEQQRRKDLMDAEAAIRAEAAAQGQQFALERQDAAHAQALERQAASDQAALGRMMIGEEMEKDAQARKWDREDQLAETAQLDAFVASRNAAVGRIDMFRQEYGRSDGGANPYNQERIALLDQAEAWVSTSNGEAELAGHMANLLAGLDEIKLREEMEDVVAFRAALEAEAAEAAGGELAQPTADMMALDAAINSGNPVQASAAAAQIQARREEEAKQQVAVTQMGEKFMAKLEEWNAAPIPYYVNSEADAKAYSEWKDSVTAFAMSRFGTAQFAAGVQGLRFQPGATLDSLTSIFDGAEDPIRARLVEEAIAAREVEQFRAKERIKAEEGYVYSAAHGDPEGRRKDAERGDPDREMSYDELVGEAVRLYEAGDLAGAAQATAKAEALKPKE